MSAHATQTVPTMPKDEVTSFFEDARADAPLGTLLFRAGLVPDDLLREALEHSKIHQVRLGEVLLQRRLVSERDLCKILAAQKGLEFVDVSKVEPDPRAVSLLAEEGAREWGALVIALEGDKPVVAVADPSNRFLFGRIAEALDRKPRFAVAVPSDLVRAIDAAYESVRGRTFESLAEAHDESEAIAPRPASATVVAAAQVVILLTNGERVPVTLPISRVEAIEEARELIRTLDERAPGGWPLADGRFLRPEAIVSVDVIGVAQHP